MQQAMLLLRLNPHHFHLRNTRSIGAAHSKAQASGDKPMQLPTTTSRFMPLLLAAQSGKRPEEIEKTELLPVS